MFRVGACLSDMADVVLTVRRGLEGSNHDCSGISTLLDACERSCGQAHLERAHRKPDYAIGILQSGDPAQCQFAYRARRDGQGHFAAWRSERRHRSHLPVGGDVVLAC